MAEPFDQHAAMALHFLNPLIHLIESAIHFTESVINLCTEFVESAIEVLNQFLIHDASPGERVNRASPTVNKTQ